MGLNFNQRLDDLYNTRILLALEKGQFLSVEKGRLQFEKALPKTEEARKKVKALVSDLLSRVEVGTGPLTTQNVHTFIFNKVFPLHHSLCDPSAMQKNKTLKEYIDKKVEALRPEVERDFNVVRCNEKIQRLQGQIRLVEWQLLNPLRKLKNLVVWIVGAKTDGSLEKKLRVLKWQLERDERFSSALKEALYGLKMNLSHETGAEKKGWSGSFFWKSYLDNRTIGVFKPSDQDSISPGSPHPFARFRFNLIPASHGVLVSQSGKSHIAEAGARIAADLFHEALMEMQADGIKTPFDENDAVVPNTQVVEINFSSGPTEQGIGSFQLFLNRCQPLASAFKINKRTYLPERGSPNVASYLPHYQWLKLFHYAVFAQDDHAENTMVVKDESERINALKAIDNGQSFPAVPLNHGFIESKVLSMKPLFGLKHPLAKKPILPFFKEFLQRFSQNGYWDRLCQDLGALYQDPKNYLEGKVEAKEITENRIRLLKKRFGVMERLFIKQGRSIDTLLHFLKGDASYE